MSDALFVALIVFFLVISACSPEVKGSAAGGDTDAGAMMAIVEDGEAKFDIIYANQPSDYPIASERQQERFEESLSDFVRIVSDISGAELKAFSVEDAEDVTVENTIQIGPTPAARQAGLTGKADSLKPHALIIHSDPERKVLYLTGSTLEGAGHAMYEFLETLGCRWFYPGKEGETLPEMSTITVPEFQMIREPEFEQRSIQLTMTSQYARRDAETRSEFYEWMRRNKFGGWAPPRGHNFHRIVGRDTFEEHPEYYALRDGQRSPTHLCMTNPDVTEAAVEFLTGYFTENPDARGYPVALADGAQFCECPDCTAACEGDPRDIMGLYLDFTREIFDRIDEKFPGREFQYGFYVYSNLMAPPDGEVPHQLAPYLAPLGYDPFHTFLDAETLEDMDAFRRLPDDLKKLILNQPRTYLLEQVREAIKGWGSGTSNMYLRDYDPYITFQQNLPVFRTYQLALEIPWYKSTGVRGFTPEACSHSWFAAGLNHWIRSRLYWNTELDIQQELEDMCRGMFGPAWEPMYEFFDALSRRTIETDAFRHGDEVLTRLYSVEFARHLGSYIDRAEKLAETEMHKRRVNMWRLCQRHMVKYLKTRKAEEDGHFAEAHRRASDYLSFLEYVKSVNHHYVDHHWYYGRPFSMYSLYNTYRELAERQSGESGELLVMLPQNWYFRHDPDAAGMEEEWYDFEPPALFKGDPDGNVEGADQVMPGWLTMRSSHSWQREEAEYEGFNWYRNAAYIPERAGEKEIRMVVTGIFGHMDFFINGRRVTWQNDDGDTVSTLDLGGSWSGNYNQEFDVDVTDMLRPGEVNSFTFRSKDMWNWGGIFKSVFLYVPAEGVAPHETRGAG